MFLSRLAKTGNNNDMDTFFPGQKTSLTEMLGDIMLVIFVAHGNLEQKVEKSSFATGTKPERRCFKLREV